MKRLNLDRVRVASPCTADWDSMTGDDRARFCASCQKHVYNFSALTQTEIEELIRAREGNLCARFYRRHDGTMLTADCRVGRRRRRRRDLLGFAIGTLGMLAAYFGMGMYFAKAEQSTSVALAPIERLMLTPWGQKIVNFFHGRPVQPPVTMGVMVMGDVYVPPSQTKAPTK